MLMQARDMLSGCAPVPKVKRRTHRMHTAYAPQTLNPQAGLHVGIEGPNPSTPKLDGVASFTSSLMGEVMHRVLQP